MKINEVLSDYYREIYGKDVTRISTNEIKLFEKLKPRLKIAIEQYKNRNIIYRGVPSKDSIILVDPTKVERSAANTYNYVNLLQSNLPNWQEFPPRNKSLICSGSQGYADSYGKLFVVLPLGNPTIGIVPSSDWFDVIDAPMINRKLRKIYMRAEYLVNKQEKSLPETKDDFFAALKFIEKVQASELKDTLLKDLKDYFGDYEIRNIVKFLDTPIIESLAREMDPIELGFKHVPLSEYKAIKQELWFSAPALLIEPKVLREIL